MKTFDFKNRLFVSYAAMTIGIVGLFAVLLILLTSHQNRETERMYQQQVFLSDLSKVEALLSQADRLATRVSSDNEILNIFIALDEPQNALGGGENYFDDQLMDTIRLDSLLSGINGTGGFADRISVYNRYGDYVSTGRLYETKATVEGMLSNVAAIDAHTEMIRKSADYSFVSGLERDAWSDNPNALFVSVMRTLSYTNASTPYALVSVQLQADRFTGLDLWSREGYMIIDDAEAPRLLYSAGTEIQVDAAYEAIMSNLNGQPVSFSYEQGGDRMLLYAARADKSNWLLVRALPMSALTAPYMTSYLFMILGCALLMALLLIVVNYMAVRIARPLRHLTESIAGVDLQNMRLGVEDERVYSTRELSALSRSFHAMLLRLDKSIALEMQAYMRVLQSQMNPHFLYNMLSVIIASSEAAGDEKTVSMCLKLTAMLRYVADFKRELAPMRDELEHARNYLMLMKERYEDLFTYAIEADEEALGVMVPKLTVQPLCENCFGHGFETSPPWHVEISLLARAGRFCLRVEDNGVGMTDAEIAALTEKIEIYRQDVAGNYQELSLGGMGLVNTLLRLSLNFEDIHYEIQNRLGGGLRVEIGGEMLD